MDASEAGGRAGRGVVPVLLVATGGEGERRSELDSHVGRQRVSMDSQENSSFKGRGRCSRESADFTEVSVLSHTPFSANTTLRIELQDLALAIAFRLTREVRDAADCQSSFSAHNPLEIPVSHAADLALCPAATAAQKESNAAWQRRP